MLSGALRNVLRQETKSLRFPPHLGQTSSLSRIRLVSSLAVLEQRDGQLQNASLSAVTAAQKLGGPVTCFVAGGNIKAVAEEAAKVKGVDKIIMVDNSAYDKVCQRLSRLLFFFYFLADPRFGRAFRKITHRY